MPDISFRAEAAGFSAPDPLLFEFGFKLGEDDFQVNRARPKQGVCGCSFTSIAVQLSQAGSYSSKAMS
eukprot:scaffold267213_cov17-Tisochrysis_lutea.AAC.1